MKQTLCLLAIITSTAAAHANESRRIHAIDLALGRMEKGLVDQDASTWTLGFKDAHAELFDEGFTKSPKRAALLDRYRAAIKAAGVVMGPRAAKIVAREEREEEVKEEAVAILKDGISICSGALSPNGGAGNVAELDQSAGEYAKKLERAMRVDPRVVLSTKAYVGSSWGGAIGNIAACELGLAFRRSTFEDSPPVPVTPLDGQRKTVKGCGFVEYTVRAEKLRGGKVGAWEADGNESYARPLACKDFPSRAKAPSAAIKAAVVRAYGSAKGGKVYEQFFDGDDASVRAVDFEKKIALVDRYKIIGVRVYKPDTLLRETSCLELDPKIACAASGEGSSAVNHYDDAKFRMQRAEARKKQGNVAQCKRLLAAALDEGRQFSLSRDTMVKYKTTDGILDGATLERKMKALVALGEERSDSEWCSK